MGVAHHLATFGSIALARAIGLKISNFHFVSQLKSHINLNGIKMVG